MRRLSIHIWANGQLGLLFLTIAPTIYNTRSSIVFVPPDNPDPSPVIPQGLTAAQIADTHRQYDVDLALYTEYNMTAKVLKSLLIAAVEKTYIRSFWGKYIGNTNITTKDMLAPL